MTVVVLYSADGRRVEWTMYETFRTDAAAANAALRQVRDAYPEVTGWLPGPVLERRGS